MRLDDIKPSDQVEDRRGGGGGGFGLPGGGGGGFQFPIGGGGGGFSISTIILLAIAYLALKLIFGIDLLQLVNGGSGIPGGGQITIPGGNTSIGSGTPAGGDVSHSASNDVTGDAGKIFVGKVLTTTEMVWTDIFKQLGRQYERPRLVLFTGFVQSACGMAQSAMGPFYCPGDHKVYIDLSFYNDLRNKLGAPGDFAQAYVIAHEVGHHVQTLLGISDKVNQARSQASETESNGLSVRMELQADCYAGIWAKKIDAMAHILEQGDVEEALNAAAQIGDDRLQKRSQGYAVPDTFTHGTSAQRVKWFKTGTQANDLNACDTFGASDFGQ
jgi:predicted metalloprotease